MSELAKKQCVPCAGGVPPLSPDQTDPLLAEMYGWVIQPSPRMARQFKSQDFEKALAFVNRIGAIGENENHHPDIKLTWGKVGVEIWTHKIGGLTESDFILAAKFDEAYQA